MTRLTKKYPEGEHMRYESNKPNVKEKPENISKSNAYEYALLAFMCGMCIAFAIFAIALNHWAVLSAWNILDLNCWPSISLDRFFPSSKLCSNCGWIKEDLSLRDREWQCSSCTEIHDRDINAAKNILAAGEYLMKCTESGAQEFTSTRNDSRESE